MTFLRPAWLLLLPALIVAWLWWWRRGSRGSAGWENEVDPALRPYVIEPVAADRRSVPVHALFVGWALVILILAGPVFERRDVPVWSAPSNTVVLLDLSRSMRSDDLVPDRATRARFKIDDLLERGDDARFALVGFAERPYAISPLTDDVRMLRAFLGSLTPDIMPVQGSRLDLAIDHGVELLRNAGLNSGSLFLLTDQQPGERDLEAARRAASEGFRMSVLGVGTEQGAPLRDANGRFQTRQDGSIIVPKLDTAGLARLAVAGRGGWSVLTSNGSDLAALWPVRGTDASGVASAGPADGSATQRVWIERGPWLLWPLVLACLLLFRRESLS